MSKELQRLKDNIKTQIEEANYKVDLVKDYISDLESMISDLEDFCATLEEKLEVQDEDR